MRRIQDDKSGNSAVRELFDFDRESGHSVFGKFIDDCRKYFSDVADELGEGIHDDIFNGFDWENPGNSTKTIGQFRARCVLYLNQSEDLKEENRVRISKAVRLLLEFIITSEIHILFGALRNSEGRGNFHFNFLDSFVLFDDYARDCSLFGITAKAVSLKCSVGNEKHFASRKSFRSALFSVGPSIRTFTEHMKNQFEMVRLCNTRST